MQITKDTLVSDLLSEYGSSDAVIDLFGGRRMSKFTYRRFKSKGLTVEGAAKLLRTPLNELLAALHEAIESDS